MFFSAQFRLRKPKFSVAVRREKNLIIVKENLMHSIIFQTNDRLNNRNDG